MLNVELMYGSCLYLQKNVPLTIFLIFWYAVIPFFILEMVFNFIGLQPNTDTSETKKKKKTEYV